MSDTNTPTPPEKKRASLWIRLWPIYLIAAGLGLAYAFGLQKHLSLETLREQREVLRGFVTEQPVLAVGLYLLAYAAATMLMIPGALWITITGGFLFGLAGGSAATVVGATLGASLLFFAAQSAIGRPLRERAGPIVKKLENGFQEDALSYMLAMRFIPVIPFPVSNIAPAVLGAQYWQFFIATALGIIPGVIAYTWIGASLGATFDAGETATLFDTVKNFIPAFVALGVVALLPVVFKKFFGRKAARIEEAA